MKDSQDLAPELNLMDLELGEVMPEPQAWLPVGLPQFAPRRQRPDEVPEACKRRDERVYASVSASVASIDPLRDPANGQVYFHASDDDRVFSLSRRGAGVRCSRPPEVGTRLLVQLRTRDNNAIALIGRTCWTRVEYEPGEHGARAVGVVGLEFVGGSQAALDRYASYFEGLLGSVVTPQATG